MTLLRCFAPCCALLHTCVCRLRAFALICVFLRPTMFRMTAFGNIRLSRIKIWYNQLWQNYLNNYFQAEVGKELPKQFAQNHFRSVN